MIVHTARTADTRKSDRFDYWRSTLSSVILPLDAAAPHPEFRGELRWADAGAALLIDAVADPHRIERTQRLIDQSASGYYKMCVQLVGRSVLTQGSRTAKLEPGDFAIYDTDRPYSLDLDTAHHMLVVMFPKTLIRLLPSQVDPLLACRIPGHQTMGALVFAFLSQLALQFDHLTNVDGVRLGENIADLLTSVLLEQLSGQAVANRGRTLWLQVTTYIERHLRDPHLSPEVVASAHGYATRSLQKLFQDNGVTIAGWIRDRRLEQCRRTLRDPAWGDIPVGMVGSRWGFENASHFSRAFKAAYGVSPRAYRAGCGAGALEAIHPAAPTL